MKHRIKSVLKHIYQPRLIIFCIALYNFVTLWRASNAFSGIACVVCPWYYEWSFINEPSILLLASAFLLFEKWWGNLVSTILSGYVFIKGVYLITVFGWSKWIEYLPAHLKFVREYELDVLKEWEIQLIFALIVFSFAAFYLMRNILSKTQTNK